MKNKSFSKLNFNAAYLMLFGFSIQICIRLDAPHSKFFENVIKLPEILPQPQPEQYSHSWTLQLNVLNRTNIPSCDFLSRTTVSLAIDSVIGKIFNRQQDYKIATNLNLYSCRIFIRKCKLYIKQKSLNFCYCYLKN